MGGGNFELMVRPFIAANIRPAGVHPQPLVDPSEQAAKIAGSSAQIVKLSRSYSNSWSKSNSKEKTRTFDLLRVFKKDGNNVDESTYVDLEVATKIKSRDAEGIDLTIHYAWAEPHSNIRIISRGNTRDNTGTGS